MNQHLIDLVDAMNRAEKEYRKAENEALHCNRCWISGEHRVSQLRHEWLGTVEDWRRAKRAA